MGFQYFYEVIHRNILHTWIQPVLLTLRPRLSIFYVKRKYSHVIRRVFIYDIKKNQKTTELH